MGRVSKPIDGARCQSDEVIRGQTLRARTRRYDALLVGEPVSFLRT
jgi:hypothetical protein